MAEGGTLFLDEIGEMPVHLQTKLLSVLEDKKIKRLGGDIILPVNVRIIAATSSDLENTIGKNFRSDLYYRLNVIRIHIPPLRERRQDIPGISAYFLKKIAQCRDVRIDESDIQRLMEYDWPGNVRELRNILERACLLQKGPVINPAVLLKTSQAKPHNLSNQINEEIIPLMEMEKRYISAALEKLSSNYTRTAQALKISLSTLKRKIKEYGLK